MVINIPNDLTSSSTEEESRITNRVVPSNSIADCLQKIKSSWKQKNNIAGLVQDWANIAGPNLSSNCFPLSFRNQILVIGASHPQWRQALFYNRHQLIESLKSAGYEIKDIKIKQHYLEPLEQKTSEKDIWNSHPSRADIHGTSSCRKCGAPSPKGEIELWGKCGFCRRQDLSL